MNHYCQRNTDSESSTVLSSLQNSLKLMNDSLLCAICKEVYATPVIITVCSHNFCSICIRRYFTIKQECPLCGLEASTANLIPNRVIETLIKHFENLRCILKSVTGMKNSLVNGRATADETSVTLSKTSTSASETRKSCDFVDLTEQRDDKDSSLTNNDSAPGPSQIEGTPMFSLGLKEFCTQSQGFPTQTNDLENFNRNTNDNSSNMTSQTNSNSTHEQSSSSSTTSVITPIASQDSTKADCPVCGLEVATTLINSHLDSCLAREEKKNSLRQNTPKRHKRNHPPTAKLAYNLLSLRDLRKKLKEIGLPTNGDKNELKRRHQEFLIKYQAEMDKFEPRAVSVLIDEIKREELSKKEMEKKQNFMGKLSPIKSSDPAAVNLEHMRHHAKQYKELEETVEKSLPKKRRKLTTERKLFEERPSNEPADNNSELIAPDSCPSILSTNEGLLFNAIPPQADEQNGDNSPELYMDEPCTSGLNTSNLRQTVESDSQADEIKNYIDASLSEAY